MPAIEIEEEARSRQLVAAYRRHSEKQKREDALWEPLLRIIEPMADQGASFSEMLAVAERDFPHLVPALKVELGL